MFYTRHIIVVALRFRFRFHFELIFNKVWFIERGSYFWIWTSNCSSTILLKRLSFLHWNSFSPLLKINWLCVGISLDSTLGSVDLYAHASFNMMILVRLYNRPETRKVLRPPLCMPTNFPSARAMWGNVSSPSEALSAPGCLWRLWLVQTPNCIFLFRLIELCVFPIHFPPSLLFFSPTMPVGMGFHSLLQIKSGPNGSKTCFHS